MATDQRRGPRKSPPALDKALAAQTTTERWITEAATFLTALESSVLAGDALIPVGLSKRLHDLLRNA